MDFTREPIVESIITPKEGCKLAVRNSKGIGQEEFFVDSLEIVSFSGTYFYRSMERPKAFLLPATDYEVIEVREARMMLKTGGHERSVKAERSMRGTKKQAREQAEAAVVEEGAMEPAAAVAETKPEGGGRKRERRGRHQKRQRVREEAAPQEKPVQEGVDASAPELPQEVGSSNGSTKRSTIIPPPSSLISETLGRYREDQLFKDVFFVQEEIEQMSVPPEPSEEAPAPMMPEEQTPVSEEEADPFNK